MENVHATQKRIDILCTPINISTHSHHTLSLLKYPTCLLLIITILSHSGLTMISHAVGAFGKTTTKIVYSARRESRHLAQRLGEKTKQKQTTALVTRAYTSHSD